MTEIHFISTFEMYDKEESGKKPNTLRSGKYYEKALRSTNVRIRRGYTKKSFVRTITDVTLWEGQTLISWNPNEVENVQDKNVSKLQRHKIQKKQVIGKISLHEMPQHVGREGIETGRKEAEEGSVQVKGFNEMNNVFEKLWAKHSKKEHMFGYIKELCRTISIESQKVRK